MRDLFKRRNCFRPGLRIDRLTTLRAIADIWTCSSKIGADPPDPDIIAAEIVGGWLLDRVNDVGTDLFVALQL
jgi:hypothetical protein